MAPMRLTVDALAMCVFPHLARAQNDYFLGSLRIRLLFLYKMTPAKMIPVERHKDVIRMNESHVREHSEKRDVRTSTIILVLNIMPNPIAIKR